MSPKTLRSRLSANPIPDSPVFRIQAKGKTADEARLLANGASNELIRYSTELNRSNPDASRLFREFQRAAQVLHERRVERNRVRDATGPDRTDVEQRQLVRAETRQDAAQLRYETVRNAYKGSQESQASTALVQILTKATDADSNRGRVLQVLLFIGLVGGLVLGVTLATLRANRVIRQQVLRQSA